MEKKKSVAEEESQRTSRALEKEKIESYVYVSSCISILLPEQRAVGFSEYNHIPSTSGAVPSQWGAKPPYRGKQINEKKTKNESCAPTATSREC